MLEPILTVELVPESCWYTNVRSNVPRREWDCIRRAVYRRARHQCEVCGGVGSEHPVECHEVWHYDDERKVQRLVRLIALCPPCHRVKHMGLAGIRGQREEAMRHLAEVNGWSDDETEAYVHEAFSVWTRRSQHRWELDIAILGSEAYKRWISRQLGTAA